MEAWHHFEWNHPRVLDFSCVVTLFPSNGKAEINAIETAAQPTAPLLYYTSSTYFTHWLMAPPGPGANSMKVCFRRSWICCEVTHFKHGHSDNIDCSGIFRRTRKWYILYETQKAWRCYVFLLDHLERLETGVKTRKLRLLIYWKNKVLAPVQRKLNKHLSFLTQNLRPATVLVSNLFVNFILFHEITIKRNQFWMYMNMATLNVLCYVLWT